LSATLSAFFISHIVLCYANGSIFSFLWFGLPILNCNFGLALSKYLFDFFSLYFVISSPLVTYMYACTDRFVFFLLTAFFAVFECQFWSIF